MSEHWYTRDGQPSHTRLTKKGTERATTLRDARLEYLLPSVSSILAEATAPELERYKQNKLLEACLELAPSAYSTTDEWMRAVREKADSEKDEALSFGTAFHKAMETGIYDATMSPFVAAAEKAMKGLEAEGVVIQAKEAVLYSLAYGYAGTTDIIFTQNGTSGILDFKTCKTKPEEPIDRKPSHIAQIAAYVNAAFPNLSPCSYQGINIYVSKTEPGRVDVVRYDGTELKTYWDWFLACSELWRIRRGYDPRKGGKA